VFLGKARETVTVPTITKDKLNLISTSSSAGLEVKGDGTTDGTLQLNCSQNSHGIKLASPPHSAGQSYTLTFPQSISADTFLKTDGSGNLSFASAGGTNTPAWSVRLNATQNISNQTYTKVNFDTEIVDTDNAYDNSSNYRWTCPSGEAGKYLITTSIHFQSGGNAGWEYGWIQLRKNGTAIGQSIVDERNSNGRQFGITYTIVNDVAVSDYYEIWGYISNTTGTPGFGGGSSGEDTFKSTFAGYKLIGV